MYLGICWLAFWSASTAAAQEGNTLRISVFNESTSIPFTHVLNTPVHPGIQVGTDLNWKNGDHYRLYPSISVGYLFHRDLYQAVYLNLELGYDLQFDFGLNLKSAVGLGYLHTFNVQPEFQFEDGSYRQGKDRGNARLMPSLSLGWGYRLQPANPRSPEIFMMYQSWLEYPYSPGFIPLMTHTNLHLGINIHP
ncbi:hypothetical protein CRP01_21445 [Flavilitoribacter nigricans DSM 23189 = NBRC 102662]|uniref:Outer membrane protein beta-barrel domain-containing protein n=2 Tax=Flavilitoribacter TaxID=2762562 RepID=A0A2D0N7S6_FLAN2|nr:hypothetical protein CRP01_21445 [Flavilitoribacter nigricans DSM 23189 = NBRC 102662]